MHALTLLLADSRFPSGSYAHSLGLEQAVNDGLTDVPAFMRARQRLVAEADARFAVEARRGNVLEQEWCARCPSPVLRAAARRLGAQLLRSASAIWDVDTASAPGERGRTSPPGEFSQRREPPGERRRRVAR